MKKVICLEHPLVGDLLGKLRNRETGKEPYRVLCDRISLALAMEASRSLPLKRTQVETPLETADVSELDAPVVVVPILRAGLGMLSSFLQLFPDASVGYIGLERDKATARASEYYCKLPVLTDSWTFVIDPMLASGGSACAALDVLKEKGAGRLVLVSILASPEGVKAVQAEHPEVEIVAATMDRELDDKKYIRPGLGDFGDRLFGT